ncbi:hypothetical protein [Streptomyces sp. WZ-12]|uniref:hypothetical protein n=1 Tax=Streptomyces sp. WZ-12 TaxID=3030210 RepID=UPI002381195C|nr:hypothetical protein [Streptomyces sp. WZ-12]
MSDTNPPLFRKRVTERFNMGSYEFVEASVDVEYSPDRHDLADIEETIDHLLVRERLLARKFTTEENSFVHVHPGLTKPHSKRS